ncbi:hypothetical protein Metho_0440 [Methanomethylovorans hollandica DSM 15978]|uniref:Uncharacterized protein n=1 Tax=Methanomethylovorans hollandica (strain DSM 15978 / NBRC 107637 / DMS1) TaxID=867904 RepID=L0KXA4_METHD|nr:hypothetical protein Metho_0440 [Methanomethylovorans hollandica DSM 15978]
MFDVQINIKILQPKVQSRKCIVILMGSQYRISFNRTLFIHVFTLPHILNNIIKLLYKHLYGLHALKGNTLIEILISHITLNRLLIV